MNEKSLQKKIEELEARLKFIEEHPHYESFLADLTQMKFWDSEIKTSPISVKSGSEEDTRAFGKVLKYMLDKPKLQANLEAARAKLLPGESEKAEQASTSLIDDVRRAITQEYREQK